MKNIIIILAAIFCLLPLTWAQEVDSTAMHPTGETGVGASDMEIWDSANEAYTGGDYQKAATLYTSLVQSGKQSAKLYYNLGNAYFKQNKLGNAILNYNRAQLLAPGDEDIAYNLAMANARTVDKIEDVPEFFLTTWIRNIGQSFNSNAWTAFGLVFLALALGAVILWLVSNKMSLRKTGFYGALFSAILMITSISYAQIARTRQLDSRHGIVMNSAAPVKSSPSASSKDIFVLHEGTKFIVNETLDGWHEISIADGNKGWIQQSAVELIK